MPGSSLICLLTYSTIPKAAFPTDLMVIAENTYGNMAPMSKPANTSGFVSEISFPLSRFALWRKPPNNDNETRAADPMANPLPMAAVVLPAASRPSVLYLTYSPIPAISAIPPALSEIGP